MDNETKAHLSNRSTWLRLLFMLLFGLLLIASLYVALAVAIIQFGFVLFTGELSRRLHSFANQLSQYIHQSVRFLLFSSEYQPFPFNDWPKAEEQAVSEETASPVVTENTAAQQEPGNQPR